jgi:hypothetical protein
LLGQYFDIRLEVHAPVNGSEAPSPVKFPDETFTFTVEGPQGNASSATSFFGVSEPAIERWNFTWYEDLFAFDKKTPSLVNVTSKAYRKVFFKKPGTYHAVRLIQEDPLFGYPSCSFCVGSFVQWTDWTGQNYRKMDCQGHTTEAEG